MPTDRETVEWRVIKDLTFSGLVSVSVQVQDNFIHPRINVLYVFIASTFSYLLTDF